MAIVELTEDNFEDIITSNDLVVVDFWATWCAPCRTFAPIFETTSEKYPDIVFGKVDTEARAELAGRFEIRSIPTLMLVREKVILYSKPGAVPAQSLEALLDRMLAVDMTQVREEIALAESGTSES
jgi:thioredoxin 1